MENRTVDELILELVSRERNYKQIDGALATMISRYDIENAVTLSMVLYSHIVAFAYYETSEAVDMVSELLDNYSSYELREIAKSTVGEEVTEFYTDIIFADYQISESPIIKSLENSSRDLAEQFESLDEAMEKLEEIAPGDKQ